MSNLYYDRPIRLIVRDGNPIENVSQYELWEEKFPTLKDLCMIMDSSVFDGVSFNLASEIAKGLNVSSKDVYEVLSNIGETYRKMSDKEAFEKFWESKKPT